MASDLFYSVCKRDTGRETDTVQYRDTEDGREREKESVRNRGRERESIKERETETETERLRQKKKRRKKRLSGKNIASVKKRFVLCNELKP